MRRNQGNGRVHHEVERDVEEGAPIGTRGRMRDGAIETIGEPVRDDQHQCDGELPRRDRQCSTESEQASHNGDRIRRHTGGRERAPGTPQRRSISGRNNRSIMRAPAWRSPQ
jgi:hypothetical protein